MIGFFRRIRKKLADDNQLLKYSRYAIGEIVLVVVGILIALSINNWNESSKQNIELNEYLIKIAQNMKEDIGRAIELKEWRDSLRMNAQKARIMIVKGESDIEIIRNVSPWVRDTYFIPNTSGYEALKSSGYLGKLKNTKIDSLLHNYYTQIDNIKNKEVSFNGSIESMEAEFIINHSFITYNKLMERDSISNAYTISEIEEKLRPFIYSKPYQAAIYRTSHFGTNRYLILIRTGEAYIEEVEGKQAP
jgi:hypothetical protein